jgi:multidrug efflux pump subunit AcrB
MESGYGMDYHKQDLIGRFAQHKVAANLLMLLMLIAGAVALSKLNTQFLPSFQSEFVVIRVTWPGAAAEDVSRSVITPLEQSLRDLDFVKQMTSTAYQGSGVIVLEYETGTEMGLALDQAKQSVDTVRNLPSDAEQPVIYKWAMYEDIATLVVTSNASREELRALAYKYEQELLDAGVAKVEFIGVPEEEIAIQVSSRQIAALGQSLPQLGQKIGAFSRDIPAGTTGRNDLARELRATEQKRTVAEFEQLAVLTSADGQSMRLADFAEIERRPRTGQVEAYYQGQPAVLLKVRRTQTSDTLEAANIVNDWLQRTRATLPPSLQIHAFNETYVLIEDRIDLLIKNGLGGLVLVIAILFVFLNGRVAFWVTVGIPVSFMATLAVLYVLGGSINMVSMFALIMALGIIVDDAIVVGEDALTHFTHGENPLRAAEGGARRMFVPVMSSSLTTLAAFLPLMLVSGIFGAIMAAIPLVICCVIIASLI